MKTPKSLTLSKKDAGSWIAIVDDKVVVKEKKLEKAYSEAKKLYPKREPVLDVYLGDTVMVV